MVSTSRSAPAKRQAYDADDIRVLEGLEPVRMRPGMYIGGTDLHGYHHLLREILDNSIDEAINGHASAIHVVLDEDYRGVSIEDDGRGIPVAIMKKVGRPAVEVILCTLHAGGKFGGDSYDVSGGLHGVGSSVVNALSEEMSVVIKRDGFTHTQSYARGVPTTKVKRGAATRATGTKVHFRPDAQIFGDAARFDPRRIKDLLDAKAYLHPNVTLHFEDPKADERLTFHHPEGLKEFLPRVVDQNKRTYVHKEVFHLEREDYPR
ncbi:MAG: ATP-binding protein, partial [Myxococcota bacterium]